METTKYTVSNRDGCVLDRGLSLKEAAIELLTYNDHKYEIIPSSDNYGGFILRATIRGGGGDVPMADTVIWSLEKDRDVAEADIYRKVLAHYSPNTGAGWNDLSVVTDEKHNAMMAELAAEESDEK